jgi:Transposase and inactivated derivatives
MIPIATGVRVWLAAGHTDMRKGFDGLAALVQETLKRNPHDGHLFVFRGRSGGLIKVLWHDGQGMCLFAKRLERGRFVWPLTVPQEDADQTVTITSAQLGYLLEGSIGGYRSTPGVHKQRAESKVCFSDSRRYSQANYSPRFTSGLFYDSCAAWHSALIRFRLISPARTR